MKSKPAWLQALFPWEQHLIERMKREIRGCPEGREGPRRKLANRARIYWSTEAPDG